MIVLYLMADSDRRAAITDTVNIFADVGAVMQMVQHICRDYGDGIPDISIYTDFKPDDLQPLLQVPVNIKVVYVDVKDTAGKLDVTLVPPCLIRALAEVMTWGIQVKGYKRDEWRKIPAEDARAALFRHLLSELEDPGGVDAESKLPHTHHIAFNVMVLSEKTK